MNNRLEQLFNRRSDADRNWGPFLRWRPAQTSRYDFILVIKLLLSFTLALMPALFAGTALGMWVRLSRPPLSALGAPFWAAVMPHFLGLLWVLPLALALRVLLLLCHVWAWNRRADRLFREGASVSEIASPSEGVWPPPPAPEGRPRTAPPEP